MNLLERKMLDILRQGKDEYGYIGVKAEFEAEGTRMEELLRLNEIARKAGVDIGLKVGGCEAIRDLIESKSIGVEYIIAPMIESPYALGKFIEAKNKIFSQAEQEYTQFLFNLETINAYNNLDALIEKANCPSGVDGVVFGRVDFSLSIGLSRNDINGETITEHVLAVAKACSNYKLDMVVGGGVSINALSVLERIDSVGMARFETRKVIFDRSALSLEKVSDGLLQAVHFELLWLQNKREYYSLIEHEDESRINMLEARWKVLSQK